MSQSKAVRELSKFFEGLFNRYRYRPYQYFDWMLDLHLSLLYRKSPEIPNDALETVQQALRLYEAAVSQEAPLTDILGGLYMELSSHGQKQWMGQFFTPEPIAAMMAAMTIGEPDLTPDDGDLWRTIDPACGSGVMMLAAANQVLSVHGQEGLQHWSFTGVDLDPICSKMMACQFMANSSIFGFNFGEILVLRGNSLGHAGDLQLVIHATAPTRPEVVPAKHPSRIEAINAAAQQAGLQMAFDFGDVAA